MKKTYGYGNSRLELTEKAQKFYDNCDPLDIEEREIENENGEISYLYNVSGAFEFENLTAEQVNKSLEELADELGE